jgi:hypothetical protein
MASRGILKVSEFFYTFFLFLSIGFLTCVFTRIALQKSNKKLSDNLDAMKAMSQSDYNRAKEVTEHVEEELALARLIRHVGLTVILCRLRKS